MNSLDVDRILGDFRAWLEAVRAFEPPSTAPSSADDQESHVDLATLVGNFLALKQEVNLQTRASRAQLEQTTQALEQLRQSLALLERQQENLDSLKDETLRPLLKSVLDAYDVLALAHREVQKIHDTLQLLIDRYAAAEQDGSLPVGETDSAVQEDGDIPAETITYELPPQPEEMPPHDSLVVSSAPPVVKVNLPWWARLLGLPKKIDEALAPYHSWREQQQSALQSSLEREHETLKQRVASLTREKETRQQQVADLVLETKARREQIAGLAREQETQRQQIAALKREQEERRRQIAGLAQPMIQSVQSILTGYRMSLQRLERAIAQHGLEPIATVGEVFDPERMEALEVVHDSGRPRGEVTDEVRRGYLWHGKVFRFAQVRVSQ